MRWLIDKHWSTEMKGKGYRDLPSQYHKAGGDMRPLRWRYSPQVPSVPTGTQSWGQSLPSGVRVTPESGNCPGCSPRQSCISSWPLACYMPAHWFIRASGWCKRSGRTLQVCSESGWSAAHFPRSILPQHRFCTLQVRMFFKNQTLSLELLFLSMTLFF